MALRQEVCQYGHNEWYTLARGDRQCAACARNRKHASRLCVHGHNDWIQGSGKKRMCKTCADIREAEKQRYGKKKGYYTYWAPDKDRKKGRGGSYEDTWSRSELLRIRGYVV